MNFAKSVVALAGVVSLGIAATQGAVAETTESEGSGTVAESRAMVWKSESFKSVVKAAAEYNAVFCG
jgi:maltose-binding protein MalE